MRNGKTSCWVCTMTLPVLIPSIKNKSNLKFHRSARSILSQPKSTFAISISIPKQFPKYSCLYGTPSSLTELRQHGVLLSPHNLSDACRPARGADALIIGRVLFEHSELARPSVVCRPSYSMRPDGASLVLGPFAETKGPRLPGRNPASIIHSHHSQ